MSLKMYNLSGGAPVKKKVKQVKSTPKKAKKMLETSTASTQPVNVSSNTVTTSPVLSVADEQAEKIKVLQAELTNTNNEYAKCESDLDNELKSIRDASEVNITNLTKELNLNLDNLQIQHEQEKLQTINNLNSEYTVLFNVAEEKSKNVIRELETKNEVSLKKEETDEINRINQDNITKLANERVRLESENNAQIAQMNNRYIQNLVNEYTGNKSSFAKDQLVKLCPKDSVKPECANVINIPNLYNEIKYLGCYQDYANRHLSIYYGPSNNKVKIFALNPNGKKQCADKCKEINNVEKTNFTHFALQDGAACFCGSEAEYLNGLASHPKLPDSTCFTLNPGKTCTNNSNEICGGPWINAIYKM